MADALRVILYFLVFGLLLVLGASGLMWWMTPTRRLGRAINTALGKVADATIYDISSKSAAGLDFSNGDLAIMWQTGENGLVFTFSEIEGAELIVDEKVVARAQKGEHRRVLDETFAQARHVVLRLMFNDIELPEFEIVIYGTVVTDPVFPKTASEAVRLGRKWLSHIDAVIKRHPDANIKTSATVANRTETGEADTPPWQDNDQNNTIDE
jgi:hypothetical protein